jgi:integrase
MGRGYRCANTRVSSRPNAPPAHRAAAGLEAITLGTLRHSNISRMRAAGIAADVVAAWHGHTERMTQAVYGRVTDDRLTAAADVFSSAVGQI